MKIGLKLITLVGLAVLCGFTSPEPLRAAPATPRVPVIVELFTSEGCSDCPPADIVLSHLGKAQPVPGVDVIALSEHVDYWNHGGWADPYSSHALSARQSGYADAFHLASVYTPQMVVDGQAQFVGSDAGQARAAILRAARTPKTAVSISPVSKTADGVSVTVRVAPVAAPSGAQVFLAVTEDGLRSNVTGGENSGRRLAHSAVVRELRPIGTAAGLPVTLTARVSLAPSWSRAHLHAVVFVQARGSRHILGAAETDLPA